MNDPGRIVVAGDWHGSTAWACGVIDLLPNLLPDESPRILLHLGDFGLWPGLAGGLYLAGVSRALAAVDAELWFVDGNHDDHDQIRKLRRRAVRAGTWPSPTPVFDRISWVPRGYRWKWHSRTWMALGGAASVDKPLRVARGLPWWPGELLTRHDVTAATRPGPVDVVVAHDAPSSVPLDLPRPAPEWWDLTSANRHQQTVQCVADAVRPSWWLHGHYHLTHDTTVRMAHGDVHVTGLDCDGALTGNYRVLDTESMRWLPL